MSHRADQVAALSQPDTPSSPSPFLATKSPPDPIELIRTALSKVDWPNLASPSTNSGDDSSNTKEYTQGPFVPAAPVDHSSYLEALTKADTLKRSESPFEACLSDSVGSPASARDFFTSPSLFDDCDFEFDDDPQVNFPLFPGPSFDSQVITAAPSEEDPHTRDQPATAIKMGSDQSRPASPQNVDVADWMATDGSVELHHDHRDAMTDLKDAGLSGFMVKEEEAEDEDAATAQLFDRQRLFSQAMLEDYQFASALHNGSRFAPLIKLEKAEAQELKDSIRRDGGTLAQAFGRLHDDAGRSATPPREATPANLVPYYKEEDVMTSSGSTLALALQTSAPLAHAVVPTPAGDRAGDELDMQRAASPKAKQQGSEIKSEATVGPARQLRTRRKATSPIAVTKFRAAKESKRATASPAAESIPGKRFQCEVCSKWFDRAFNLKTHMFTHEDPDSRSKNFICPDRDCGKAFARKHDMKRHFNTVHLRIVKRTSSKRANSHAARDDDQG